MKLRSKINDYRPGLILIIENLEDFIKISGRKAKMTGTVFCPSLVKKLVIRDDEFNLYQPDRETGDWRITYKFSFTEREGNDYYLEGYKVIYHDEGKLDLYKDMTTLYTSIYRIGKDRAGGELLGKGILEYQIVDLPAMLASMEVTNSSGLLDQIRVRSQYFSFIYGELRNTYFDNKLRPNLYLLIHSCLIYQATQAP